MNGILNIYKEPGMTSFDVVARLRKILKIKKIGHTGTLDPDATGVLPICIGYATGAIDYISDTNKCYIAEITLGIKTDTQDASGIITEKKEVNITSDEFETTLEKFIGKLKQIPPMYSAVKINGKKLYELAREGKTIERKSREILIYSLKNNKRISNEKYQIEIKCSKGTYIRTLCEDIGEELKCGAHMSSLVRTKSGPFEIDNAIYLNEVKEIFDRGDIENQLISVENVFYDYDKIILKEGEDKKLLDGQIIEIESGQGESGIVRVYDEKCAFFALGETFEKEGIKYLKSKKFFIKK